MAKKNEQWKPSRSEIEFLRIFANQADEAQATFQAKMKQLAMDLGVAEEEWDSGAVAFDWQVFKRKEAGQ